MRETLLILGASARAAAQSAIKAGFRVWAADLFADADLAACADAMRVRDYPRELRSAAANAPLGDWLYTGALENHPRLVQRIARSRKLLGCPYPILRDVRRPTRLAETLHSADLLFPETCFDGFPAGEKRRWLVKPFRSAGGAHIRFADENDNVPLRRRLSYFQRYIDGTPSSAVFVGNGSRCLLLGATRQLIGCRWTGGAGFQYCGSIGPVELNSAQLEQVERVGRCLVERFRIVGLFGVDFVLAGDEVWTLEVNPRYTASVEVLERSLGIRAIASHVAACRDGVLLVEGRTPATARQSVSGKAIVFARAPMTILPAHTEQMLAVAKPGEQPHFADIPHPGTRIAAQQPVYTCFAEGPTCQTVEASLRTILAAAEQRLIATYQH